MPVPRGAFGRLERTILRRRRGHRASALPVRPPWRRAGRHGRRHVARLAQELQLELLCVSVPFSFKISVDLR